MMRFFAHDGRTTHGPSTVEELMALPDFDGDTLVCPVGASDSNDWKPALAYPPFRSALLAPAAKPAPEPPPPSPAATEPCPRCAGRNPEGARFCNACGARMDATVEPPRAQAGPEPEPAPPPDPIPATDLSAPVEPLVDLPAPFVPPSVEPAPISAQPLVGAANRRKAMIASFIAAAVAAGGGLGWRLLRPAKRPPPSRDLTLSVPEPSRPAPRPQSSADSKPIETSAPSAQTVLASSSPAPVPAPTPVPAPIPRHAPKPKPAARAETTVAKRAARAAVQAAAEAVPEPAAALKDSAPPADRGFILPGIPRPVSKSAAEDEGASRQVREQFDFCSQLLAQGAFADHFDTCLCSDARAADPYRGRRGFYAGSLAKASSGGRLETKADILSVKLEGISATVNARWKVRPSDAGRETAEKWRLEDGLWCRAP